MNNPTNPFVPQGSMLEQKIRSRSRFKTAFFCVLAVNLIPITIALLMQGCRKPAATDTTTDTNAAFAPALEYTNPPVMTDTNPPVPLPPVIHDQPAAAATEYIIKAGDNFTTIAKNFPGVTVKQIQEANPTVDPRRLQVGHKLMIPAPSVTAPATTGTAPAPDAGGELIYTVKSGDNLTRIATDHGTTVRAIRSLNDLPTDQIKVGQRLKIPARAAPAPTAPGTPAPLTNPPA